MRASICCPRPSKNGVGDLFVGNSPVYFFRRSSAAAAAAAAAHEHNHIQLKRHMGFSLLALASVRRLRHTHHRGTTGSKPCDNPRERVNCRKDDLNNTSHDSSRTSTKKKKNCVHMYVRFRPLSHRPTPSHFSYFRPPVWPPMPKTELHIRTITSQTRLPRLLYPGQDIDEKQERKQAFT